MKALIEQYQHLLLIIGCVLPDTLTPTTTNAHLNNPVGICSICQQKLVGNFDLVTVTSTRLETTRAIHFHIGRAGYPEFYPSVHIA